MKSFKIKTYNEDTGYGLFRRVLVRTGFHSGQVMVVLVLFMHRGNIKRLLHGQERKTYFHRSKNEGG